MSERIERIAWSGTYGFQEVYLSLSPYADTGFKFDTNDASVSIRKPPCNCVDVLFSKEQVGFMDAHFREGGQFAATIVGIYDTNGGWRGATQQEIFEMANILKNEIEVFLAKHTP